MFAMPGISVEWVVIAHISVALILGWLVGYERYFHGRAAGTQVYCLVCMASCAVTVLAGYPSAWYGGLGANVTPDPFRVVGSILTGVGFLGAGLIVRNGVNVHGLTTAASVWTASAIGVLVGVGFYASAFTLAALLILSMVAVPRLERLLPARASLMITLRFHPGDHPNEELIRTFLDKRALFVPENSLAVSYEEGRFILEFVVVASAGANSGALTLISHELPRITSVESFSIVRSVRA